MQLYAAGAVEGAYNEASADTNGLTAQITVLDNNPAAFPSVTTTVTSTGTTVLDNPLGMGESSFTRLA